MDTSLKIRIKKDHLDKILVFLFLMASTRASTLFASDISVLFGAVLSGALALYYSSKVNLRFLVATMLLIAITIFQSAIVGALNPGPLIRMITAFLYGYWVICLVGNRIYPILSDIIAWLALISLPFYLMVLIDNDLMYEIFSRLESLIPVSETRKGVEIKYANLIVYTIWQPGRNHGFMWEPGAFGGILAVGIFFNLVIHQFKLNWKLVIMVMAMISTLSTTAILLLGLLSVFYMVNRKIYWILPVLILAGIVIFNLDFVGEKLIHQFTSRTLMLETEQKYTRYGFRSLGRFGSMVADWNDLQQSPAFGIGHNMEIKDTGTYIILKRSNGLTDYMLKYGIVGMLFLIFNLTMTSLAIRQDFPFRLFWFFPILICALAFSNPVLYTPVYMSLQSYYFKEYSFAKTSSS